MTIEATLAELGTLIYDVKTVLVLISYESKVIEVTSSSLGESEFNTRS